MAYPGQFHRLVLIGNLYSDIFNTTLSIVPTSGLSMPAVSQSLLDDVADAVGTWWGAASTAPPGVSFTSNAVLTSVKLNRIGPDGRYVDNEPMEHVYTSPIIPPGAGALAPQLAIACTIRGANERARAGKGRMFLPMNAYTSVIQSDGRLLAASVNTLAQRFHAFLQNIDGVYVDSSVSGLVGIASRSGAGAFQVMSRVSVGRVVDTIRSRRSALPEEPVYFPTS